MTSKERSKRIFNACQEIEKRKQAGGEPFYSKTAKKYGLKESTLLMILKKEQNENK